MKTSTNYTNYGGYNSGNRNSGFFTISHDISILINNLSFLNRLKSRLSNFDLNLYQHEPQMRLFLA